MLSIVTLVLLLHVLVGAALLGSISHQLVALYRRPSVRGTSFFGRYAGVRQDIFVSAVIVLYVGQVVLGAIVYPAYRLDVRIPFEEMFLFQAVGAFEAKEHFAGIGLGLLPLYWWLWRPQLADNHRRDRVIVTTILAFIVWWSFLVGHMLNNIRGLA